MKNQRQAKILEIISTKDIETQEQLLQELQEAGFYSTQATISRDLAFRNAVQQAVTAAKSDFTDQLAQDLAVMKERAQ